MRGEAGFTLLEVLIAFAILSFAMVAVVNSFSQSARVQSKSIKAAADTALLIALYPELNRLSQRAMETGQAMVEIQDRQIIVQARPFQDELFAVIVVSAEEPNTPLLQTWMARHEQN